MTFGPQVNLDQSKEMLDLFLSSGFNEVDTAYVYNMWVYTTRKMTENDPRAWHHIDIPFDDSYKIAAVKVQRLSVQPRIPQIQGLNIPAPGVDPNKSALLKLLLS